MTTYQKIWGITFGIISFTIFGLLIYGGATNENRSSILETINSLDTKKVTSITLEPANAEWKINLTIDTLTFTDTNTKHDILFALQELKQKHLTKGAKRFWKSKMTVNLNKSFSSNLKDKSHLSFIVYDTEEGLFVEMTNVMGHETYSCPSLKPLLERLANFDKPLGRQN